MCNYIKERMKQAGLYSFGSFHCPLLTPLTLALQGLGIQGNGDPGREQDLTHTKIIKEQATQRKSRQTHTQPRIQTTTRTNPTRCKGEYYNSRAKHNLNNSRSRFEPQGAGNGPIRITEPIFDHNEPPCGTAHPNLTSFDV